MDLNDCSTSSNIINQLSYEVDHLEMTGNGETLPPEEVKQHLLL